MRYEEFEKWAGYEGFDLHQWTPGCYSDEKTAGAFEGYQMRQPEIDALKVVISTQQDELFKFRAEVERLRADAELYQYLKARSKKQGYEGGWLGEYIFPVILGWNVSPYAKKNGFYFDHETVDAAIRAAMKETK